MLVGTKSNSAEVLISKALIHANTSHNEFVLVNVLLRELIIWKKESKILISKYDSCNKSKKVYTKWIFIKWNAESLQKNSDIEIKR